MDVQEPGQFRAQLGLVPVDDEGHHLVVAGQPWGIVYGMGVWGAKAVSALGWDLSGDAFWGIAPHAQRLVEPILADVTSVTNIGLIYGAIAASRWNGVLPRPQNSG